MSKTTSKKDVEKIMTIYRFFNFSGDISSKLLKVKGKEKTKESRSSLEKVWESEDNFLDVSKEKILNHWKHSA